MFDPKFVRKYVKKIAKVDLKEDTIWPTLKEYADLARGDFDLAEKLMGKLPEKGAKSAAFNGASDDYIISGVFNANTLAREIDLIFPKRKKLDILDFGFGAARLVRHLTRLWPQHRYAACEVNPSCIDLLNDVSPEVDGRVIPFDPPSDFADESFDIVYAWSIWSHFDHDAGMAWLKELHRILKPGGHALITVHTDTLVERYGSEPMLVERMKDRGGNYKKIKKEYDDTGFSYWKAYPAAAEEVGIDVETFGMAFISTDYIKNNWNKYFDYVRSVTGAPGWQDITVLKKN